MAQDVVGGLAGRVVDENGRPLVGVQVSVSGPRMLGTRAASTSAAGNFRLTDVPPGTYDVQLERIGRRSVTYTGARVVLGATTSLGDLLLETEAIELEELRVLGERPPVDPVSASISSVIEPRALQDLPLPRDYQAAIVILPHVNESYVGDGVQAGGSTGAENTWYVDGVNVTDPLNGDGGTRLPNNFIESVEVRSGGYEAEYGRALGAIVNAVTYTGSNEFEADVFGYYSGSSLADEPRVGLVDLGAESFSSVDIGARVGGRIVRDRMWFSAAYNPRILTADRQIPAQGVYEDRFTLHSFAGKLSWRPHAATNIEATLFGDPSDHNKIAPLAVPAPTAVANPGVMQSLWKAGGVAGSLRLEQRLSEQVQLHARLSRSTSQYFEGPDGADSVEALFIDVNTNTHSGGYGAEAEGRNTRTAGAISVAADLGTHRIKGGLEYENNKIEYRLLIDQVYEFDDSTYLQVQEHIGSRERLDPHHNYVATAFLQDSWQVNRRLALNAGVRWSRQQLQGDSATQTFRPEWQPRIGAVLQLGSEGRRRVFAAYGRYYLQIPANFSAAFYAPYTLAIRYFSADPRSGVEADSSSGFVDPGVYPDLPDVDAENFDEYSGGYEHALQSGVLLRARGVYRRLRDSFGFGVDGDVFAIGNPGEGSMSFLPKSTREYAALELSAASGAAGRFSGQVSYVLSRTWGNFPGEFNADQGIFAITNFSLRQPEQIPNSTGPLPSDRPHVLKLNGSYAFPIGLTFGAYGSVMSGAPLNRFEPVAPDCPVCPIFLVERGSDGRSPTLWDLNLRVSYELPLGTGGTTARLLLDVLHIGSPRQAAWLDQWERLLGGAENPTFGEANRYQNPMALRLGLEASF